MAGIWNRVYDRGEGDAPLSGATVWAAVYLVGRGVFTGTQAKNALDSHLPESKKLTTAETADLTQILANAQSGVATAKLDYMLRLQAMLSLVEVHLLENEATFRSELGLT